MDCFENYFGGNGKRILVFPYPAQGHMIPLLDLTYQLASEGVAITVLVTPKNLPFLNPLLSVAPSVQTLVLPFPNYPLLPHGVENATELPPTHYVHMIRALGHLHDPLLEWFKSHPSPPVAILSDMFLGWTHNLASELGIRRVVFSPCGAFGLSFMYNLWTRMPEISKDEPTSFPNIPGSPKYSWWQISPMYRSYIGGDSVMEVVKEGFLADVASWGLIVYSCNELEGAYLEYLKKELSHDRVWAVIPWRRLSDRGGSSSIAFEKIKQFLDMRQPRSVVYICFGSHAILTNQQISAIASGLVKSGVHFIWSMKMSQSQHGLIPSGFEYRTRGRGLMINGWAPQDLILGHPSISAFMTHCGWNSTMEAIVGGVPMLVWPRGAEQFVNAMLVVDRLKAGKRACEGAENVPDSQDLARLFVQSVDDFQVIREQVRKIKEDVRNAVEEGGSCVQNLKDFVVHVAQCNLRAN